MAAERPSPSWRIYYGDGSTFSSDQGQPTEAPGLDVQCIAFPDESVGRIVLHRWDWYYYWPRTGQWWGSDLYGLLDLLTSRADIDAGSICSGRQCPEFPAIYDRATRDPDFPVKSSGIKRERGS